MKKIYAALLSLLLIAFCFVCPVSAATSFVTFAEDFQTLSFEDNTYIACNLSELIYDESEEISKQYVILSDTQKENVKSVSITANADYSILYANIAYRNGSTLNVDFLRNDCYEKLDSIRQNTTHCEIDFSYSGVDVISFTKSSLSGEYTTVTEDELYWCDFYEVTSSCEYEFDFFYGYMLFCDDSYYFVDAETVLQLCDSSWDFYPADYDSLYACKISDEELIEQLDTAMYDSYSSLNITDMLDEATTKKLSDGFLIIAFGILPLAAMIASFIIAMRAKSAYKKLFSAIGITCAAELTVFVILLLILV